MEVLRATAIQWATECGLRPPFTVNGPEKVDYPQYGHGYVVHITEQRPGKSRMGTARLTSEGNPAFWSLDGGTF
jgi:hypothetical protein